MNLARPMASVVLLLVPGAILLAVLPATAQPQRTTSPAPRDGFRGIRGVNYVPSYARNDVQIVGFVVAPPPNRPE